MQVALAISGFLTRARLHEALSGRHHAAPARRPGMIEGHALARDRLADQVGDQQPQERFALQRREADRRPRVVAKAPPRLPPRERRERRSEPV